jgi:hypothetical protein
MCPDCAIRFNVHRALDHPGVATNDFRTRKARQRLAADVSGVLNIGCPAAIRFVNEIAGSLIEAAGASGAPAVGVDPPLPPP